MNSSSKTTALSRQTFLELPFFYLHEVTQTSATACAPPLAGHHHGGGAPLASVTPCISSGAFGGVDGFCHRGKGL